MFVEGATAPFSFTSSNTVTLLTPLEKASNVVIRRLTERDARAVDFNNVAELTEADLDADSLQAFYLVQEALDIASEAVVKNEAGDWDAGYGRIINVGNAINDNDALNLATYKALTSSYVSSFNETLSAARKAAEDANKEAVRSGEEADRAEDIKEQTQAIYEKTDGVLNATREELVKTQNERQKAEQAVVAAEGWADKSEYWYDVFRMFYLGVKTEHPAGEITPGAMYYNTNDNRLYFYNGSVWYSPTTDAEKAETARRVSESIRNEVTNMRDQVRVYMEQAQDAVGMAIDASNEATREAAKSRNEAAQSRNSAEAANASATKAEHHSVLAIEAKQDAVAAADLVNDTLGQVGETFGDRGAWYVAHGMPVAPVRSAMWTCMDGGELNGIEWAAGDILMYSIKTGAWGRITGASLTVAPPAPVEFDEGVILSEGKNIRARVGGSVRWLSHADSEGVKIGDGAVELCLLGNNVVFGALKDRVFHEGFTPTWDHVRNKPSTFPPSSHAHAWNDITGKPTSATRWPTWYEVTDKPTSYPAATHAHSWNEVSNKPDTALRWPTAAEAGARPDTWVPSWGDVTGKPASFTPSAHGHAWSEISGKPETATRWPTPDEVTAFPAGVRSDYLAQDPASWANSLRSGIYTQTYTGASRTVAVFNNSGGSTRTFAISMAYTGHVRFHSNTDGNRWLSYDVYTTGNKPTAADVGAAAASHGHSWGEISGKPETATRWPTAAEAGALASGGTAVAATKLATARTLTIGGTGKAFDGTGNVAWSYAELGVAQARTEVSTGAAGNTTTSEFVAWLVSIGAFDTRFWFSRGSWSYANNKTIVDTGVGNIHLAGCTIEVMSANKSNYTIRIITPTTTSGGGTTGAEFIYVNNGDNYAPGWRRIYTTAWKPTAADVGLGNVPNTVHATASTASTVAVRDGSGDVHCRLLRSEFANQTGMSGALAFRVNNSNDNYLRFTSDTTAVRNWLGAAASSHSHSAAEFSGGTVDTLYANNWFRTNGATGWYSQTYGGGMHMSDNVWVRIYGGKKFYVSNTDPDAIHTAGGVKAEGVQATYMDCFSINASGGVYDQDSRVYSPKNAPKFRWKLVWEGTWSLGETKEFGIDMRNREVMMGLTYENLKSTFCVHTNNNDTSQQAQLWNYGNWVYHMQWVSNTSLKMISAGNGAIAFNRVWVKEYY